MNYCKTCGKELKTDSPKQCRECLFREKRRKDVLAGRASWRRIKTYLMETEGKCSICGIDSWQGKPLPLILDHINGNASDNRLENLRLVCSNCDSQLPTYKSKNKNSARATREGHYI